MPKKLQVIMLLEPFENSPHYHWMRMVFGSIQVAVYGVKHQQCQAKSRSVITHKCHRCQRSHCQIMNGKQLYKHSTRGYAISNSEIRYLIFWIHFKVHTNISALKYDISGQKLCGCENSEYGRRRKSYKRCENVGVIRQIELSLTL